MKKYNFEKIYYQIVNGNKETIINILNENGEYKCYSQLDGKKTNYNKKSIYLNEKKQEMENGIGIYFIFDKEGKVHYIGETIQLRTRLQEHFHTPKKLFKSQSNIQKVRKDFYVQIIPLDSKKNNKTKYQLRALEQLIYLRFDNDKLYKYDGLKKKEQNK